MTKAKDFLLEIGAEEIPSGYLAGALEDLERKTVDWLEETGISHGDVSAWATPRRLGLRIASLAGRQPDREREVVGPPLKAAYDAEGKPTKALAGFARSQGVDPEALKTVDTPRGKYLAVQVTDKGKTAEELLASDIPPLVGSLSFPKSMRWEAPGFRFARPIRWVLALYGDQVVRFELAGIKTDRLSRGHRFQTTGPVSIPHPDDYARLLREAGVVTDHQERRRLVARGVEEAAASLGGRVRPDDGLLTTVTFLVESPLAVGASFDASFLELPPEVVITALREHQRYFAVLDERGNLMPHFVVVGNTAPEVEDAIRAGAERVVAARLEDARFYWQEDVKRPLADRVEELSRVVWQEDLGSLGEKSERVAALAGELAEELSPGVAEVVRRAGLLAKTDLTTEMIKDGKEFTSLEGVMGRAYALASGEKEEVAEAIYEHLLPRVAGDRLPRTDAGAILSMADKTDSVVGCLAVGLGPTGAGDPFGLRRQAQGVVSIIADRGYEVSLDSLVDLALERYGARLATEREKYRHDALAFFTQRVAYWLGGEGLGGEVARAVLAVVPHQVQEARRRAAALARLREDPEFTALALGFKRVRNILRGVGETPPLDLSLVEHPAEKQLACACREAAEKVQPLLTAGEHQEVLAHMVGLRPAIDDFFDRVLVMDEDQSKRNTRLALLKELSELFLSFADFSLMAIPGEDRGEN